ncbi:MAG: DNA-binding protein [Candidatus Micrarchaeota archaeon]|nr:DNA-binding protein [Candidatus Micrarchaeota archaeon]
MGGEELDDIQKRRLQERLKAAYLEERKKEILNRFLEGAAYERVMNVRLSSPEVYDKVVEVIVQLAAGGRLNRKLSEREVLAILARITQRREPTIEIRRK